MGKRRKKNRRPRSTTECEPERLSLAELGVELEIARFTEEAAERETLLAEQLAELRRALNQRQFSRALQLLLAAWRTDRPDRSEFIGQLEVLASREPPPLADLED